MKISKIFINISLSSVLLFSFSGCSTHLGDFTAVSSHNVRNLKYRIEDRSKSITAGFACARNIFGIPINQQDNLLQRAMDNAIRNGHNKGVDGDLIVNARIKANNTTLIIYNDICYEVTGDLIKVK